MNIADLFARIGVKTDQQKVDRFQKGLKFVKLGMVAAAGAAIAFSAAIKMITDEAMEGAAAFKQFEAETGASSQELQKWQSVATQTNNSAQAVVASIKAIATNREKIKLGQGNISGYQLLGIDPNQDPFKILEALRNKTKNLSQAMKVNTLQQIGVSKDLIQVLDLTNREFDQMAGNAFIVPPSAIDALDKARGSTQLLGGMIKYLKSMIAASLAPSIEAMNKKIVQWVKNNQDGIIKTVKTIFLWITRVTTALYRSVAMINKAITETIGWAAALKILIGVFAVLNASLILSPIGLIIAGIILLVAVLDDLYVYSTGSGKSLFGNLMKKYPELEQKLLKLWGVFKEVGAVIKALFSGDVSNIQDILDKWGMWGDIINGIVGGLGKIKDFFANADYDPETRRFGNFAGFLKAQGADIKQLVTNPKEWAMEGISDIKSIFGGNKTNNTTTNNSPTIIVQTDDPDKAGESVRRELERVYRSTTSQRNTTE